MSADARPVAVPPRVWSARRVAAVATLGNLLAFSLGRELMLRGTDLATTDVLLEELTYALWQLVAWQVLATGLALLLPRSTREVGKGVLLGWASFLVLSLLVVLVVAAVFPTATPD